MPKHTALAFASLFLAGLGSAFAGSAWISPIKDFYDGAALVAIVDVKKVTKVEVSTGDDQTSNVYVAEAEVLQTLKSDHNPTPEKRKIAIIGSTISRDYNPSPCCGVALPVASSTPSR